MKINLTFLLLFAAYSISSAQQIQVPNGNMEAWNDTISANIWGSNNQDFGIVTVNFVKRTADAHSGNYAAKIESKDIFLVGVKRGIFTLGTFNIIYGAMGGYSLKAKPVKLSGYYKYNSVAGDAMKIAVIITKWNGTANDTLANNFITSNQNVGTYTKFEIPITYSPPTETPDTVNIIAYSSDATAPQDISTLFIDDLSFEYYNADINETSESNDFSVFPNPAQGKATIQLNGNYNEINIYNVIGRKIYSSITNKNQEVVDISTFSNGVYMIEVSNGTTYRTEKLIISK